MLKVTETSVERKRRQRREAQQRRRDRWRAAGLCQTCGNGEGPKCESCLQKVRDRAAERVAERREAGVCYRCTAPLEAINSTEVKYPQCTECFMKATADKHLGSRHRWSELLLIFKAQKGRCAYTKEKLVLGGNASLDHKLPKTRGGSDTVGNLQWVTWTVNDCKRNLTHEEFVALCKKVAQC